MELFLIEAIHPPAYSSKRPYLRSLATSNISAICPLINFGNWQLAGLLPNPNCGRPRLKFPHTISRGQLFHLLLPQSAHKVNSHPAWILAFSTPTLSCSNYIWDKKVVSKLSGGLREDCQEPWMGMGRYEESVRGR